MAWQLIKREDLHPHRFLVSGTPSRTLLSLLQTTLCLQKLSGWSWQISISSNLWIRKWWSRMPLTLSDSSPKKRDSSLLLFWRDWLETTSVDLLTDPRNLLSEETTMEPCLLSGIYDRTALLPMWPRSSLPLMASGCLSLGSSLTHRTSLQTIPRMPLI